MKKSYDYLLFDLDGTLTDPMEGITSAVAYALAQYGILVEDRTRLTPFIGPPLTDSFQEFYGFSPEQAEEACAHYRVYFRDKGIFQNVPYPGIHQLLEQLTAAGKTLLLATSKPEEFAHRILDHFELAPYFSFVGGATMDGTRVRKGDVIAHVLEQNGLTDRREQVVMVGDRRHDCEGAAQQGLDCVGVLYGYGDRPELEAAGAKYLAENMQQLAEILL